MFHISRRTLLTGMLAGLGLAALRPSALVQAGLFDSLFGQKGQETLPITPNKDFYITSYDLTPSVALKDWTLNIGGRVRKSLGLTFDHLSSRPQTSMISTLECIGNPVGGDTIGTAKWTGVRLQELLQEIEVPPGSLDVVLRGTDGYTDSIPVGRAMRQDVLVATQMNGTPLPPDHGFPARLIVPGIYGMKHVKWLTSIEVVDYDFKGHWQQEGWPDDAEVKLSSRIDLPGDRETIITPRYTVKGMAFGGLRHVQTVHVSTDGGQHWKEATILPRLSPYAWVLWTYEWSIPSPGEYTLMVRSTTDDGITQTFKPTAPPTNTMDIHAISILATI